jgi:hypothetical protein
MRGRFTVCPRIIDVLLLRISCNFYVRYFRIQPDYRPVTYSESPNLLYVRIK